MKNFEYSPKMLRKLQMTEYEILCEIVRICNKFSLKYCLIGGTLLGAVRHSGFIPWDDDIDIVMPRKDYNRFCELSKTELNERYYLHNITTDKTYWLPFAKVRKKGTIFDEKSISHLDVLKGIYVDIFPLDYAKRESSLCLSIRTLIIKTLSEVILHKKGILCENSSFKQKTKQAIFAPFSIKFLSRCQIWLMNKTKKGNFYVNFASNISSLKQTIPISFYEPYETLLFEKQFFNVPKEYDKILKRLYGNDYMKLPPIEKRVTHSPVNLRFEDEKI